MAPRTLTVEETEVAQELLGKARRAYMNVTRVSRPIPEDKPSQAELFGEFFNSERPL